MPSTPDQALELTEEQLLIIAEVQSEIDLLLANFFVDDKQVDVRHSVLEPLFRYGDKVIAQVIQNYEDAGWTVVRYSDPRQGDWLSLSRS
jgi:hypothetical protein